MVNPVAVMVEAVARLAARVADGVGCEVVEALPFQERGRQVVRILIDRLPHPDPLAPPVGVTIDDCRRVNKQLVRLLEVEGVQLGNYGLEVSSPGVNRPLNKREDFIRFVGKRVVLKTVSAIDGRRNFTGYLQGIENDEVMVECHDGVARVPFAQIGRARIDHEF